METIHQSDLKKAGYIYSTLFFDAKPVYFQNKRIYEIRLVDDLGKEIHAFDPFESDSISATLPDAFVSQHSFEVSPTKQNDGKRDSNAEWYTLPLNGLEALWQRCLS